MAWRDALTSAIAAGIAWVLAVWLLGHPHPLFAAVSAIVCLSPGLPSHGRQAVGLMLGVATGIIVGELALLLPEGLLVPEGLSLLRLVFATLLSMVIAASFGQPAVVPIQAGVSAVLVLALGPQSAGLNRMEDVVVGAIIGLTFSQILLTPDPVRMIDAAAGGLFLKLAEAFRSAAAALQTRDPVKAEAALAAFSASHDSLITLGAGIDAARYAARWSLRGRLAAHAVAEVAARYDRRAIRLYASSLLFAEALANALRKDAGRAPPGLAEQILDAADRCEKLAAAADIQEADHRSDAIEATGQGEWSYVQFHYHSVSDVLHSLEQLQHSTLSVTGQHARTGEFDQIDRSG
ncbi:FUSC family protein [Roseomonas mucosa]|uniref:FUSC family protein n=1 Tax=Roseomonas mucosa TaxID=207340 RepID=UPI0026A051CC|nr:FUSC family protein [Roseomonas mucosa]QDD97024.1 Integral membrane protein [Roseomonas mucosa]